MSRASLAAALAVLVAQAAPVQAAPPLDPEATVVQELVVTAKVTGPAWWRVSKGSSVVWVLGVPPGLPKRAKWDSRVLDQHLAAARQMILPPISTAGLFDIPALLSLRGKMQSSRPLEDSLPPDLRARFTAAAQSLHQPPGRYDRWNGVWAGLMMSADFHRAARLDAGEPTASIVRAARAHGLKPRPAAVYKGVPVLKAVADELNQTVEQACLAEALDDIEGGAERQYRAADGWGRGDVKLALTGSTNFSHCVNLLPEGARMSRLSMGDEAGAIAAALEQPGSAVAIAPLRQLLAEDGVLQQLKARGYEIGAPDR